MNASVTERSEGGVLFRYSADRLPIALFVSYFIADLAVFLFIETPWIVALWAVSTLLPKACICAWNHHQQHCATFRKPILNRLLETMYGLQTGALPYAWTLHHNLGHHLHYLDQTKDESAWRNQRGEIMSTHAYSFNVFITSYPRILKVGKRYPKIRRKFLTWMCVTLAFLAGAFLYNPLGALFIFVIPMAVGLYVTAWHTYYHHTGLDTDDHMEASYNILHRSYNILTGNLGYHTAHHYRMGVHWSRLPKLHSEISPKIAPKYYKEPCFPFSIMGR